MTQVGLDELRASISSRDPLHIVNAFVRIPSAEIPMLHDYWERRLCALAEFVVANQLRVVRAAILDTKTEAVYSVIQPGRHHDVINGMVAAGVTDRVGLPQFEQGFLLSNGQFARRRPAGRIAEKAGQLKGGKMISPPTLTSEDLW